jgi:nucleotide-binding universal stress UspA family protein
LECEPTVQNYRKILVAYDSSENAKRALRKATELAKGSRGELAIVVAADTMNFVRIATGPTYTDFREDVLEHGKDLLSEASAMVRNAGVARAEAAVEEGHPADMILANAKDRKSDLIVIGRRGIRGVERFLMGSVSSSVINHSECDVLVVK